MRPEGPPALHTVLFLSAAASLYIGIIHVNHNFEGKDFLLARNSINVRTYHFLTVTSSKSSLLSVSLGMTCVYTQKGSTKSTVGDKKVSISTDDPFQNLKGSSSWLGQFVTLPMYHMGEYTGTCKLSLAKSGDATYCKIKSRCSVP